MTTITPSDNRLLRSMRILWHEEPLTDYESSAPQRCMVQPDEYGRNKVTLDWSEYVRLQNAAQAVRRHPNRFYEMWRITFGALLATVVALISVVVFAVVGR